MSVLNKFCLNALIYAPQFIYGEEIASGLSEAGAKLWFCGGYEAQVIGR